MLSPDVEVPGIASGEALIAHGTEGPLRWHVLDHHVPLTCPFATKCGRAIVTPKPGLQHWTSGKLKQARNALAFFFSLFIP